MKPLARSGVDSFAKAMASKGLKVSNGLIDTGGNCIKKNRSTGRLQGNKSYYVGYRDHQNGRPAKHPENIDYMIGYNDFEPLIVTRRVGDKRPKYSVADVDYQTDLTGLPEWFNSPSEAIYYARAVDKRYLGGFCNRAAEYREKYKTFEQKVAEDLLVKPDVTRLYQSTITGDLSTSVDGDKMFFDGGIMSYPLIPETEIRMMWADKTAYARMISVTHKATENELKKGYLVKLKPPKPTEPAKFNEFSWWTFHLENSFLAGERLNIISYPYGVFKPSQEEKDRLLKMSLCSKEFELSQMKKGNYSAYSEYEDEDEYRCPCYHAKVKEHQNAVKKYEKSLQQWEKL